MLHLFGYYFPLLYKLEGGEIMRKSEKYLCTIIILLIIVTLIILIKIVPTYTVGTKTKLFWNST